MELNGILQESNHSSLKYKIKSIDLWVVVKLSFELAQLLRLTYTPLITSETNTWTCCFDVV